MANTESSVQIIPYYAQPHVHTVIIDNTFYEKTVADRNSKDNLPFSTVVVTGADKGIDRKFVRLTDLKTKQHLFGISNYQKYGQPSLQAEELFNGYTNVWFCRVLPDNATYSNIVFLAHYRKGKILDDLGQETGKYRMEIKFSTAYASKPYLNEGALNDSDIEDFARSLASRSADPKTGYMTIPICFVRSTGRGKYGNSYSMSITRDIDAEKEYGMKMYDFNVITNEEVTRIINKFSGSLYQSTRYKMSTLISDVIDQWATGSSPVSIYSFEDSFQQLYDFYKDIVNENLKYIQLSGDTYEDIEELKVAQSINEETFDPIFGYSLNTRNDDLIPYYRNYTMKPEGVWKAPDYEVPNVAGATKPLNIKEWSTVEVGSRVLVAADPLNDGYRWLYTVVSVDPKTGNIIYDEGVQTEIDADQYDGINISQSVGFVLDGGHDGDFQEISVNGELRAPTNDEMKLLLAREFVKAFRGQYDRKILSPSRVNLDFMFDADYNMTSDETIRIDTRTIPLMNNTLQLTNKDAQALAVLGNSDFVLDFRDLNVKEAMYDLNEFRNKNGMVVNPNRGAGCHLHLDCNKVGLKSIDVNNELMHVIESMEDFDGRSTSIDLGYYEMFDPVTGKRITVTVGYFLAKYLIPHIVRYGINTPFVYEYAQLNAIQRENLMTVSGNMIRDTFRPDIDLIDWDVKEALYKSRINYYEVTDEGRTVQRACQNTRQREASALLEENNVRVLNTLKKNLEKACRGYLYKWNEPEVRKAYTKAQMEIYRPWIGTYVKDLKIYFDANEWEQEKMIMHCYVEVEFRDIAKRIILEININRPDYSDNNTGGDQ